MAANKQKQGNDMRIKVCKDGPYLVFGDVPLAEYIIKCDAEGFPIEWQKGKEYPVQQCYALCRCGKSKTKPFCDGAHKTAKFVGTETAETKPYLAQAKKFYGPTAKLTDVPNLCVHARFCVRDIGVWALIKSDDPEKKKILIEAVGNCPSGRLVLWDKKTQQAIEPDFEPSIGLVEEPHENMSGPIWVRGGILIESADGKIYEARNRVVLCRCGKSSNKPLCDGSHLHR